MDKYIGHDLETHVKASQTNFLAQAEQKRLAQLIKPLHANKSIPTLTWRCLVGKGLIKVGQWLAGSSEIQSV